MLLFVIETESTHKINSDIVLVPVALPSEFEHKLKTTKSVLQFMPMGNDNQKKNRAQKQQKWKLSVQFILIG